MLLLGMFPGSVFAAEPETAPSTAATTETTTSTQPQENPSEAATVPSETIPPTEELTKPTEDVAIPAETTEPTVAQTEPSEAATVPAETVEPTMAQTDPSEAATVPTETTEPTVAQTEPSEDVTEPTEDPIEMLSAPVALDTQADYIDNYFALLHAQQGDLEYHFLTKDADYHNPQIHAYSFAVEPELESLGFEIRLEGINYHNDSIVYPGGQLEIRVKNKFLTADPDAIQVFDVSREPWVQLTLDYFEVNEDTSIIGFWVPDINSRFAILEGVPEIALYDVNYGTTLGATVNMKCNNKGQWVVQGKNPYGFGNSKTGTFDVHLIQRPTSDPGGKLVGYRDYVAAGCLEYWKGAPIVSKGEIVNVNHSGSIGGWKDLTTAKRRQIVGYMLYGVRYLSDGSFPAKGTPSSTNSSNPAVNMAYAQQILVWSAVKGIDPNDALSYYGQDVPYYGEKILNLANSNPENYDYDETLMLVGEGGNKQDLCVVLEPRSATPPPPPTGDIVVGKQTIGAHDLAGWKMELYNSWSQAQNAANPIASAVTDGNGRAAFHGVLNGTYYVREAPASRQNKGNHWTLSDQILTASVNSNTVNAGTITNTYTRFRLRKISQCSEAVKQQIAGNAMYSLAGAKYKVSINGQQQEILTTDADGNAYSSRTYPANTKLEVQEIQAPPGYKLNSEVYKIRIQPGDNYLEVADEPVFDPPFAITKVDKTTTTPQGDGSFSGAIFKWEYFDNSTWSGTPKRTWYFKTDTDGWAYYKPAYLAPGYSNDTLYYDTHGNESIPIGTVTITEIQNSLGYIVLPQPMRCSIVPDNIDPTGAKVVWNPDALPFITDMLNGNFGIYEPIDPDLFGSFRLDKVDAQLGAVPQGDADLSAKFQVVNNSANSVQIDGHAIAAPGEVCYEFTTDESGHFTSGKIFPLGKYTITEAEPPKGYLHNASWSQTFTVTEQDLEFDFTLTSGLACLDDPDLSGSFVMDKLDAENGAAPQGDAALEGAEFELINNSKNPIVMNGVPVPVGEVLFTFQTDANGHYAFTGLPVGSYCIQEKTPPEGYLLDSVWQYDFAITPERNEIIVPQNMTCQDYVIKGRLDIIKEDSLHVGSTTQQEPLDGITFTVTNESVNPVLVDGTAYAPGEVVTTLAIAWDGQHWSAMAEHLPYGTYGVTENEMHPGMANDYYKLNPEKHIVEIHQGDTPVVVTHVNEMVEGKIVIHKVDPLGRPLADAQFSLEWSEDNGQTWNPVSKTDVLTKGGCTAPSLADNTLTSGDDGLIEFMGLYPTLKYRVTEVAAPDGYVLLRDTAYENKLPAYDYVYTMTVHNSPGFTFPTTGSKEMMLYVITGTTIISAALLALAYVDYRRRKVTARKK